MGAVRLASFVALATAICAVTGATPARAASGGVLVIGDSLEVGTAPYLRQELKGIAVAVDARTSRPSLEGVAVLRLRLRPSHRVVVFDLGTNDDLADPARLASDLTAVRRLAGKRCLVVATVSRPSLGRSTVAGLNEVVRQFVSQTPGAQLADWRAAVASHPDLVAPDGVHATPAGYELRGRLVAEAVQACLPSKAPRGATHRRSPRSKPRTNSREPPQSVLPDVDWSDLVRLTPYGALATYLRGAARLLASTGRDLLAALRPPSREPVLGAP